MPVKRKKNLSAADRAAWEKYCETGEVIDPVAELKTDTGLTPYRKNTSPSGRTRDQEIRNSDTANAQRQLHAEEQDKLDFQDLADWHRYCIVNNLPVDGSIAYPLPERVDGPDTHKADQILGGIGKNRKAVHARSPSNPVKTDEDGAPGSGTRLSPGLDRKLLRKLRAGKITPESVLDLHGLGRGQASAMLERFLERSREQELRLVLVIPGKGRDPSHADPSKRERGVLNKMVRDKLTSQPLNELVQYHQVAHGSHGGEGAFYVWLRRKNPKRRRIQAVTANRTR